MQDGAKVGDRTSLYPGVYVGHEASLGEDCLIYPHVVIREHIVLEDRVIIHSGTVIGCDGFGYTTVKGVHHKIPQIGSVLIESDVEIGANVSIDRARFDKTHIKKGAKIDNLVQIGHNVVVGENTFIVSQVGIAGSTRIGNNVILAGQSGVDGHVTIGDNVMVAGRAGVTKDVEPNMIVSGFPAQSHEKERKTRVYRRRIPDIEKAVRSLEERIEHLERSSADTQDDD